MVFEVNFGRTRLGGRKGMIGLGGWKDMLAICGFFWSGVKNSAIRRLS